VKLSITGASVGVQVASLGAFTLETNTFVATDAANMRATSPRRILDLLSPVFNSQRGPKKLSRIEIPQDCLAAVPQYQTII